jgi:glutathione S-transferase
VEKRAVYTIYGNRLSLFSRKLEAAFRFYDAPFAFRAKELEDVAAIERRAGTHQMPVLLTPENWMLGDTTPIIDTADGRFPLRRLFPDGPLGVLVHLIEEHLDEWVSRVMVHYRWHFQECAAVAAPIIAGPDPKAQRQLIGWGPRACRATGTETPGQQRAAEAEYVAMLAAAEAQLGETRYLLGDRPSAVDCAVLGGLLAHTWHDPVPRRIVAGYPRIVHWVEERAWIWDGIGALAPFPDSTPFARHLLADMASTWGRFAAANHRALRDGDKVFAIDACGQETRFLSRPYPERSRLMIAERIARRLTAADQATVWVFLCGLGLEEVMRLPDAGGTV